MAQDATLLFIYGTLKRGDVRAPLLEGQQYLGVAQTTALYRLFNVGTYPALVEAEPIKLPGRSIVGELWQVDNECLARLDEEEGVDEGLYERRVIELVECETSVQSYFYLHTVEGMLDCGACWGTA